MYKIIIIILFLLAFNVIFTKKIEKMTPLPRPERCFYDFELINLHNIFMEALSKDTSTQKVMKNKILPAVCILDLVANRKVGWEGFLDHEAKKRGTSPIYAIEI